MADTPETILSQLSFANRALERGDWKDATEDQLARLWGLINSISEFALSVTPENKL